MNWADIIVLCILIAAVAAAVFWIVHRRKRGKTSCGNCPYRGNCASTRQSCGIGDKRS